MVLGRLIQDVRYTRRLARKSPGFFATVVVLLGLGIGLNCAIFSLVDALLLRPLPVARPNELVRLVQVVPQLGPRSDFTYNAYRALKEHAKSFADVFGYNESIAAVRDGAGAYSVRCQVVTGSFFTALGAQPLHGRILAPADELSASGSLPIVLSYLFWMRRFGGDPSVIGQKLTLQDRAFTIAGVTTRGFNGIQIEDGADVYVPLIAGEGLYQDVDSDSFRKREYTIVARLRPGISMPAARAEAEGIVKAAVEEQFHGSSDGSYWFNGQFQIEPVANGVSFLRAKFSAALFLLMGSGALLLLIVCANVGGLLLARTTGRRGEIAIRMAVGATGRHLMRQWITESLLVTISGSVVGFGAALAAMPLLIRGLPPVRDLGARPLTLSLELKPDARLFALAFLLCLASALLAGLPAAIQATRHDVDAALRAARATARQPLRWLLVAFQVALCTILLSVCGLLVSSFHRLRSLDPGFDRDHIVTFSADPGILNYTAGQSQNLRFRLMDATRAMPGVASVAFASRGVMRGTGVKTTYAPAGEKAAAGDFLNTSLNLVSPEYFHTMGMRILRGRGFGAAEPKTIPEPVIVNRAFVRRFYSATNPIGQQFGQGWQQIAKPTNQIVGVVSDAKYRSLREAMQPIVYHFWRADDNLSFILHVRTRNHPSAIIDPVRRVLHSIDPRLPFDEIHTLAEEVNASLWPERTLAWLSAAFSATAAVLAAIGVFSALAYAIAQMKREIGIRVALGASPSAVVRLLSAKPIIFAGVGVAAGVAGFRLLGPVISGLMYGVSTSDPVALAGSAAIVLGIVLCAALAATGAALRFNPASLLRED